MTEVAVDARSARRLVERAAGVLVVVAVVLVELAWLALIVYGLTRL